MEEEEYKVMDSRSLAYFADTNSWSQDIKTIKGNQVILVAKQPSRRTQRKKKTVWVYWIKNTQEIIYNQSRNGICFMKMAADKTIMKLFFETFVQPPITPQEKSWLDLNGYEIL